jgi:hypothetical protein
MMVCVKLEVVVVILWWIARVIHALPSNDECFNATIIPAEPVFPYLDSVKDFLNATESPNEPRLSCFVYDPAFPASTLFYFWTPTVGGLYDFSTVGSTGVDDNNRVAPTVALFSGGRPCDAVNKTEVVCGFQFLRGVPVVAGTTYTIGIVEIPFDFEGNRVFGGQLQFSIRPTPPATRNDACRNATVLPAAPVFPYRNSVSLARVTKSRSDPVLSCNNLVEESEDLKTIWYQWTPQENGVFDFSTIGSTSVFGEDISADSFVGVYQGRRCSALQEIACGRQRLRRVPLVGGTPYFLQVATIIGSVGDFLLLVVEPTVPPPPNDDCTQAQTVNPWRDVVTGDTRQAFPEGNLTACGTFIGAPGVWYTFRSNSTLLVSASTCHNATNFDTKLSVFRGRDCAHLKCVGGNDDACGLSSTVSVVALPGWTYWILVHGVGAIPTGSFTLTLTGTSSFLALVDANTSQVRQALGDIDYSSSDYPATTSALNIQAVVPVDTVRSMRVSGDRRRNFCETTAPYSIFGDRAGNFYDAILPIGRHVVKAVPYGLRNCQGPAGPVLRGTFQVTGCAMTYQLYTGDAWVSFLTDGAEIAESPCAVNLLVTAECGFPIQSVQLVLQQGNVVIQSRVQRIVPYFLWSTSLSRTLAAGQYTLRATVDGIAHEPLQFTVLRNSTLQC